MPHKRRRQQERERGRGEERRGRRSVSSHSSYETAMPTSARTMAGVDWRTSGCLATCCHSAGLRCEARPSGRIGEEVSGDYGVEKKWRERKRAREMEGKTEME